MTFFFVVYISSPKEVIPLLDLSEVFLVQRCLLRDAITFCTSFGNCSNSHVWSSVTVMTKIFLSSVFTANVIRINHIRIYHYTPLATIFAYLYSASIKCNIDVFSFLCNWIWKRKDTLTFIVSDVDYRYSLSYVEKIYSKWIMYWFR